MIDRPPRTPLFKQGGLLVNRLFVVWCCFDESVDVLDIVLLVSMILGTDTPNYSVADLNSDGEINVLDVILIVNLILN